MFLRSDSIDTAIFGNPELSDLLGDNAVVDFVTPAAVAVNSNGRTVMYLLATVRILDKLSRNCWHGSDQTLTILEKRGQHHSHVARPLILRLVLIIPIYLLLLYNKPTKISAVRRQSRSLWRPCRHNIVGGHKTAHRQHQQSHPRFG